MCANRLSEGSTSADEGSVELELKRADEEDVSYTLESAELVPLLPLLPLSKFSRTGKVSKCMTYLLLAPESSSKEC